jgi:hypothetical protein
MEVTTVKGKITLLRVNEDSAYGPPNDRLDAEVIVKLENDPKAFGLKLKPSDKLPVDQAMFALLQDAFNSNETVYLTFEESPGKQNHYLRRVARTR